MGTRTDPSFPVYLWKSEGMSDSWEINYNLNPLLDDSSGNLDSNGLIDGETVHNS
ncbi:MAG: hypothetical protein KAU62_03560 [Candidatus Heimdallarchaeota archaeon]|nr:hypothetical protein [Candidatus Heimdallarchaeota archaeon]MCG3255142.1 hypothetical protein [Candidatus Heimdallarchaeota archaeon]MCK4610215.1 hypothetical protein [Candidatus Heimdallarchaeota archaeon]